MSSELSLPPRTTAHTSHTQHSLSKRPTEGMRFYFLSDVEEIDPPPRSVPPPQPATFPKPRRDGPLIRWLTRLTAEEIAEEDEKACERAEEWQKGKNLRDTAALTEKRRKEADKNVGRAGKKKEKRNSLRLKAVHVDLTDLKFAQER